MNRFSRLTLPIVLKALCLSVPAVVPMSFVPSAVMAQSFAPVAIVNDEIITGYDVDQRQRLLAAASGGSGAPGREVVIQQLIDDALRLQAARAAGIVPTQEQIKQGFDELSRSNGREGDTMRRYFNSQGVTQKSLDRQVAAEVAWRELVPRTFLPRIRISEAEIDDAMGVDKGGSATSTETEYLISEIRLPIGAEGETVAMNRARLVLQELRQGGNFGQVARQVSQAPSALAGGDRGWVPASVLSDKVRAVAEAMTSDRVSAPFVDGNEVVLIGLRDVRAPGSAANETYVMSQIVVGVAPNAPQSIANDALDQARAARARITDCASIEAIKDEYLPISGDLGQLTTAQMPAPVREAVVALPVGGISEPVRSNDGFHILVVCDKITAEAANAPEVGQMRNRLTAQKLARHSQSFLRKLRREAVIERR